MIFRAVLCALAVAFAGDERERFLASADAIRGSLETLGIG